MFAGEAPKVFKKEERIQLELVDEPLKAILLVLSYSIQILRVDLQPSSLSLLWHH
jgi:hypothetical protein